MRHPGRWVPGWRIGGLLCVLALAQAGGAAEELVSIAEIEGQPESFHLRHVTLKGRVHDVRQLDPYFQPSGTVCTGAYLFLLQDETGFLRISVLGVCGVPLARALEVAEDDEVFVKAVVHAPGKIGASHPVSPYAVASEIRKVRHDESPDTLGGIK